jgi:hypothetical protein
VTPLDRVLDALRAHGGNPKRNGANWQAKCPAHDDRVASLSVSEGDDGRVLLHCHAGCPFDKICADLGLEQRDLFADDRDRTTDDDFGTITARYVYADEDGTPLFRVNRTSTKKFWQERSDGNGAWIKGLGKTRRVLYRLPAVIEAITKGETIYIVEGEKDADAGARAGVCATTSPMGAGKWNRKEFSEALRGARAIVLVADDDEEGAKHVEQVGRHLRRHGNRGEITITKAKTGKDLFDHLAAGHTIDELQVTARSNGAPPRDETESPAPGATDDQGGDEKATQPPGNSDTQDTDGSEAPDMPNLELDPDQAASVEKLMEQMKELDPDKQKSFLGELMKLAGKKSTQATDLVDLAKEAGVDLWHDGDGIGYASAPSATTSSTGLSGRARSGCGYAVATTTRRKRRQAGTRSRTPPTSLRVSRCLPAPPTTCRYGSPSGTAPSISICATTIGGASRSQRTAGLSATVRPSVSSAGAECARSRPPSPATSPNSERS